MTLYYDSSFICHNPPTRHASFPCKIHANSAVITQIFLSVHYDSSSRSWHEIFPGKIHANSFDSPRLNSTIGIRDGPIVKGYHKPNDRGEATSLPSATIRIGTRT